MNLKILVILFGMLASLPSAQAVTIQQTAQFDGQTPERLYHAYLSSKEHSAFTGAPAQIDPKVSGEVSAFGGQVKGTIFQLVPGRLIVQKWRGAHTKPTDLDTTLILTFRRNDTGAEIEVVHTNVPEDERLWVNTSWNIRYWDPLKKYLNDNH